MRCPRCKGIAHHYLTDIKGDEYFECNTALTSLNTDGSRGTRFHLCDTIIDNKGKAFKGHIAFMSGNELKSITI